MHILYDLILKESEISDFILKLQNKEHKYYMATKKIVIATEKCIRFIIVNSSVKEYIFNTLEMDELKEDLKIFNKSLLPFFPNSDKIIEVNKYRNGKKFEQTFYKNKVIINYDNGPGKIITRGDMIEEYYFYDGILQRFDGPAVIYKKNNKILKKKYMIYEIPFSEYKFNTILNNVKSKKFIKYSNVYIKDDSLLEVYRNVANYFNDDDALEICRMYDLINKLK